MNGTPILNYAPDSKHRNGCPCAGEVVKAVPDMQYPTLPVFLHRIFVKTNIDAEIIVRRSELSCR